MNFFPLSATRWVGLTCCIPSPHLGLPRTAGDFMIPAHPGIHSRLASQNKCLQEDKLSHAVCLYTFTSSKTLFSLLQHLPSQCPESSSQSFLTQPSCCATAPGLRACPFPKLPPLPFPLWQPVLWCFHKAKPHRPTIDVLKKICHIYNHAFFPRKTKPLRNCETWNNNDMAIFHSLE